MLDWLACAAVRLIGGLLCRLPASVAVWLGACLGQLASWLQPKRTQIGVLNVRAAFDGTVTPTQTQRIIRACYRQMGASLVELLRLPVMDRAYVERFITIEGLHRVESAMASGRPTMFLTGHYGNWELSSITAALMGYPVVALARAQERLPRLYRLLVSYRESKGCTVVHKGGAVRQLLAALEARKPIGIVGDQASRQGIFVNFFGRPALFATGPFELAHAKQALIIPFFIHRTRGPFHRIVVEPPIELSPQAPKAEAIRQGIERFAALLAKHIQEDPAQWLWMHKRWKHTPARRVLLLSDRKLGHVKQSLAVVEALRLDRPHVTHEVIEVAYRHRLARVATVLWSWWAPAGLGATRWLAWALTPISASALLTRYADAVISCGASLAPVNLLWASANRAKSIVLMNPAPLPLARFHLVIAPRHDGLPRRPNVLQTSGALVGPMSPNGLNQAKDQLKRHPRYRVSAAMAHPHPVVAVFIGGQTGAYALSPSFAETLVGQVRAACEACDGWYLVTTSRRTTAAIERAVAEQTKQDPACRLMLLASRDPLDGTMHGMLGSADVAIVTGESISMITEACTSGRRVIVVELPKRGVGSEKHQRFLRELAAGGYIRLAALPELSEAIGRALRDTQPPKRLDNLGAIHDAVARLI